MAGAIPKWNSVTAHMQIVIAHIQDFTVTTQYVSNHVVIHIHWGIIHSDFHFAKSRLRKVNGFVVDGETFLLEQDLWPWIGT